MSVATQRRAESTTVTAVGAIVHDLKALRHGLKYWRITLEQARIVFRSTAPLSIWLCFFLGLALVIQSTDVIGGIGADRGLAGIAVGALGLREVAINVSLLGIAASAGAGYVTELGAMRVAEEIDALEVMGIDSHSYLLSTRMWGTFIAAVPLIVFCIAATFAGGWAAAFAQRDVMSVGSFGAFFWRSIATADFPYALIKGSVLAVLTVLICTSLGYRASGGPVGVGLAVGKALDLSIVSGMLLNLAMTYAFWGLSDTLRI